MRMQIAERCTYHNMIDRCYRSSHKAYHRYGGRGILVCDEWRHNVDQFLYDMGLRPNGDGTRKDEYQLDRIDNDLGYFKENCRWVQRSVQVLTRTSGKKLIQLTSDGITMPVDAWAEILGVTVEMLYNRKSRQKTHEEILTGYKHRYK